MIIFLVPCSPSFGSSVCFVAVQRFSTTAVEIDQLTVQHIASNSAILFQCITESLISIMFFSFLFFSFLKDNEHRPPKRRVLIHYWSVVELKGHCIRMGCLSLSLYDIWVLVKNYTNYEISHWLPQSAITCHIGKHLLLNAIRSALWLERERGDVIPWLKWQSAIQMIQLYYDFS